MRDIVLGKTSGTPSGNKENVVSKPTATGSAKTAGQSVFSKHHVTPNRVRVEMKTRVTPQQPRLPENGCNRAANLLRTRSNASALAARKTPVSSKETSNHHRVTPAGLEDLLTPGHVRKMVKEASNTPYRSTPSTNTPMQQNKTGVTPVKRKLATTPVSSLGSKLAATPMSNKLTAISESLNQSTVNALIKNDQDEEDSHVTVAVRVRPLNQREMKENDQVVTEITDTGLLSVSSDNSSLSFQYDHCFGQNSTQVDLFRALVFPLLNKALEGYNACLFSYGQTGSGKTYSMMGIECAEGGSGNKISGGSGIIPRFGFSLFEKLRRGCNVDVEVSYFEIYNEKIRDLLSEEQFKGPRPVLRVREHPQHGPYVEGLTSKSVASFESLQGWLRLGVNRRATAASAMNDKSSRSHCIFSVTLTHHKNGSARRSKVHLVDLAGSERLVNTCATGDRLREGVSINTSLLTLGKVITALADKQKRNFVPYRESLLTWLLSDSLGGSARTVMLATISPARMYCEETLATLRYACHARAIVNKLQVQNVASANTSLSTQRALQDELERLKAARDEYERRGFDRHEIEALHEELAAEKEKVRSLQEERMTWEARVTASDLELTRQTTQLEQRGVAGSSAVPVLILLTTDPLLSVSFALPGPSCTRKMLGSCQPPADILLNGPLVAEEHCLLELRDNVICLQPLNPSAECYVNGTFIDSKMPLAHGDRLALGGEFFLLVQLKPEAFGTVDYEFARMELSLAQNARLNSELTKAKEQALAQLNNANAEMQKIGDDKRAAEVELELIKYEKVQLVKALEAEVQAERHHREVAASKLDLSIAPFHSNLLQDLEDQVERDFADAGAGLGLHEMRCLVREASQRSKRLKLNYRFGQVQQVQGECQPGQRILQPCIRVLGDKNQIAICSPDTFITLIGALRECENENQDTSYVLKLLAELSWESEEEINNYEANFETSVTVDVTPFRRHLLSLSLTVHEEDEIDEGEKTTNNAEDYLSILHSTLAKLQVCLPSDPKCQLHLSNLKNAICQLERCVVHPYLESFQHSEPSTISYTSCSNASNHQSGPNMMFESRSQVSMNLDQYEITDSHSSLDQALENLQHSGRHSSEPSTCSSASTLLHSPPSLSAQPHKSTLRDAVIGTSPGKEVRFSFKKSQRH